MARRSRSFKALSFTDALQLGFRRSRVLMCRPNLVERYMPEIEVIALAVKNSLGEAISWSGVVGMSVIVGPLWQLMTKAGKDLSDEEKRDFVVDAFWVVYRTLDGGPSGKENNVDISEFFSKFGRESEEVIVPMLVQFALRAVEKKA